MNVLGAKNNAVVVQGKCIGVDFVGHLAVVASTDDAISLDIVAQNHSAGDGPVVFSVSTVVLRCASKVGCSNDDDFLADPQCLRALHYVINAFEHGCDAWKLPVVIASVGVESGDRHIYTHTQTGFERCDGDGCLCFEWIVSRQLGRKMLCDSV